MQELQFEIHGLTQEQVRRKGTQRSGVALTAALLVAAGMLATKGQPPPPPPPPPLLEIVFDPNTINFDPQSVDTTSGLRSLHVTNRGLASFEQPSFALAGDQPTEFSFDTAQCMAVPAGDSCIVQVGFAPKATGERRAQLTIASPDGGILQMAVLTGVGMAPNVSLAPGDAKASEQVPIPLSPPTFHPAPLEFPHQIVGLASTAMDVVISNPGPAVHHIERASPVEGVYFAVVSDSCVHHDLAAGESCRLGVSFTPRAAGYQRDWLIVEYAPAATARLELTGTGTIRSIRFYPDALRFGRQEAGSESATREVTVENVGTAEIRTGNATARGDAVSSFRFAVKGCANFVLVPGAKCTIPVRFLPESERPYRASLVLADRGGEVLGSVLLEGEGTSRPAPEIYIEPLQLDFTEPNPPSQSVTIANTGNAPLRVTGISVVNAEGKPVEAFKITDSSCADQPLGGGGRCIVPVKFTPKSASKTVRDAQVRIEHTAPNSPQVVQVHWEKKTEPPPQLTPSPSSLSFGDVRIGLAPGEQPRREIRFTNSGPVPIRALGFSVDIFSRQKAFAIETNNCNHSLDVGASCTIAVSFGPREVKAYTRTLNVWDDRGHLLAQVPLGGNGWQPDVTGRIRGPGL